MALARNIIGKLTILNRTAKTTAIIKVTACWITVIQELIMWFTMARDTKLRISKLRQMKAMLNVGFLDFPAEILIEVHGALPSLSSGSVL
ncbi:uncharacterized protein BDZ99DRAFT_462125 [Mytilinidion resinicola]|uniref:Uncharacterized protein n=1 Tax=Mytilinidion resinicola TaxID=574789 RepID=A0A6A6YQJ7_9PEZI|nr:uncharacterized protein BDZ99DRAFT_462125 [Mytilinidion resinicola]KAF2810808.1 hypothetical protein BDZ99DRAFT_462125 [Mytilinidion resinicola]